MLCPPLRCSVVSCVVACAYWVVCFVVSVFACCVGVVLVLGFVLLRYVSWRALRYGVLCCQVVFWCVRVDVGVWSQVPLFDVVCCCLSVGGVVQHVVLRTVVLPLVAVL